jgi:alkyl sulfatase BDS1-like metallo-beta-lactamase superfamily hydrolase
VSAARRLFSPRSAPASLLVAVLAVALCGCGRKSSPAPVPEAHPQLAAQAVHFERGVREVADGVWVATGYGLANTILLETPGGKGVVIVDTQGGRRPAEAVRQALVEAIGAPSPARPVLAIILTHHHADHVYGGAVFTAAGAPGQQVPVYAHATTSARIDEVVNVLSEALYPRTMRMFGQFLPEGSVLHGGIGPRLDYDPTDLALARPTETVDERRELEIDGLRMVLVHAPGETDDQLFVWLPDRKVLLPGDNIYRAFPNLYTLRGTPYRDVMQWVASLDAMRDLGAEVLVPSHTTPVVGAAEVADVLTAYRDAIQYVHDQTIRGANHGRTPDELAAAVHLPPHLAEHPWLQEVYGTVAWSVRGIYDGYLGWFDGDAVHIDPLPPADRAEKFRVALQADLPLDELARRAVLAENYQWAAELADLWGRLEPDSQEARDTQAAAFEALATRHPSVNARHYYLTQAAELRGELKIPPAPRSRVSEAFVDDLAIGPFLRAMPVRLKAEETLDRDTVVAFHFPDVGESYTVHLRHGIAEIRTRAPENPDLTITVDATTWKRLAFGQKSPTAALATGALKTEGGVLDVVEFLRLFER